MQPIDLSNYPVYDDRDFLLVGTQPDENLEDTNLVNRSLAPISMTNVFTAMMDRLQIDIIKRKSDKKVVAREMTFNTKLSQGISRLLQGRNDEAENQLRDLSQEEPSDLYVRVALASCLIRSGQFEKGNQLLDGSFGLVIDGSRCASELKIFSQLQESLQLSGDSRHMKLLIAMQHINSLLLIEPKNETLLAFQNICISQLTS